MRNRNIRIQVRLRLAAAALAAGRPLAGLTSAATLAWDRSLRIRGASGATLAVLERTPAELRGLSLEELFERPESLADALHFGTTRPMRMRNGQRVRVEAGPCPGGAVAVLRRPTSHDLELAHLTSAIGHELRNAFASVMLAIQSLSRQEEVASERGKRRLALAERELRRIECALRGIQELGRGEVLRPVEVVPEKLMAEALENVGPQDERRSLIKIPAEPGPPAQLDKPRVCLAIEETIRLAIRYLSPNDRVELRVERKPNQIAFITHLQGSCEARPIQDPSTTPDLALAVIQGVARSHGGHTEFIHHPGGFTILLVIPQRQVL